MQRSPAPAQLSTAHAFDRERMTRVIQQEESIEAIRSLAVQLLVAWHSQRLTCAWLLRQAVPSSSAPSAGGVSGPPTGLVSEQKRSFVALP